jgi:hypothetical protein
MSFVTLDFLGCERQAIKIQECGCRNGFLHGDLQARIN